jgi:adenine/guanine phosphoribosyltransferase-like PRPP-binding protein
MKTSFPIYMQSGKLISTGYLSAILEPDTFNKTIEKAIEVLSKKRFKTLIVRGLSGVIIGTVVAHRLGKELVIVRKPTERSHGSGLETTNALMANLGACVFFDDFIESGATLKATLAGLREYNRKFNLAGIYLYARRISDKYIPKSQFKNEYTINKVLTDPA